MGDTRNPPISSYSASAVEDVLSALVLAIPSIAQLSPGISQCVVRSLLQSAFDDMSNLKNRPLLKDRQRIEDHHYEILTKMVMDSWDTAASNR